MTWKKQLRDTKFIHENTKIPYGTIRSWRDRGRVPVEYFDRLQHLLGLTLKEMRELNEQQ